MKKLAAAVLALTLTLGMGLTAFAAPSPEKEVTVSGATNAQGQKVEVTVTKVAEDETQVKAVQAEAEKKAVELSSSKDITVTALASAEVSVPAGTVVNESNPITVVFNVPTVQAGWTVFALHQKADGTWEKLSTVVANGTVTVKFTSLSPVVFVREETVAAAPGQPVYSPEWYEQQKALYSGNNAASNAATTAGITSPKTGE